MRARGPAEAEPAADDEKRSVRRCLGRDRLLIRLPWLKTENTERSFASTLFLTRPPISKLEELVDCSCRWQRPPGQRLDLQADRNSTATPLDLPPLAESCKLPCISRTIADARSGSDGC